MLFLVFPMLLLTSTSVHSQFNRLDPNQQYSTEIDVSEFCRRGLMKSVILSLDSLISNSDSFLFMRLDVPYGCYFTVRANDDNKMLLVLNRLDAPEVLETCRNNPDFFVVYAQRNEADDAIWKELLEVEYTTETTSGAVARTEICKDFSIPDEPEPEDEDMMNTYGHENSTEANEMESSRTQTTTRKLSSNINIRRGSDENSEADYPDSKESEEVYQEKTTSEAYFGQDSEMNAWERKNKIIWDQLRSNKERKTTLNLLDELLKRIHRTRPVSSTAFGPTNADTPIKQYDKFAEKSRLRNEFPNTMYYPTNKELGEKAFTIPNTSKNTFFRRVFNNKMYTGVHPTPHEKVNKYARKFDEVSKSTQLNYYSDKPKLDDMASMVTSSITKNKSILSNRLDEKLYMSTQTEAHEKESFSKIYSISKTVHKPTGQQLVINDGESTISSTTSKITLKNTIQNSIDTHRSPEKNNKNDLNEKISSEGTFKFETTADGATEMLTEDINYSTKSDLNKIMPLTTMSNSTKKAKVQVSNIFNLYKKRPLRRTTHKDAKASWEKLLNIVPKIAGKLQIDKSSNIPSYSRNHHVKRRKKSILLKDLPTDGFLYTVPPLRTHELLDIDYIDDDADSSLVKNISIDLPNDSRLLNDTDLPDYTNFPEDFTDMFKALDPLKVTDYVTNTEPTSTFEITFDYIENINRKVYTKIPHHKKKILPTTWPILDSDILERNKEYTSKKKNYDIDEYKGPATPITSDVSLSETTYNNTITETSDRTLLENSTSEEPNHNETTTMITPPTTPVEDGKFGKVVYNICTAILDKRMTPQNGVFINSSYILIAVDNFTLSALTVTLTTGKVLRSDEMCNDTQLVCQTHTIRMCLSKACECDGVINCGYGEMFNDNDSDCDGPKNSRVLMYLAAVLFLLTIFGLIYMVSYWLKRWVTKVSDAFFIYAENTENVLFLETVQRRDTCDSDSVSFGMKIDDIDMGYPAQTKKGCKTKFEWLLRCFPCCKGRIQRSIDTKSSYSNEQHFPVERDYSFETELSTFKSSMFIDNFTQTDDFVTKFSFDIEHIASSEETRQSGKRKSQSQGAINQPKSAGKASSDRTNTRRISRESDSNPNSLNRTVEEGLLTTSTHQTKIDLAKNVVTRTVLPHVTISEIEVQTEDFRFQNNSFSDRVNAKKISQPKAEEKTRPALVKQKVSVMESGNIEGTSMDEGVKKHLRFTEKTQTIDPMKSSISSEHADLGRISSPKQAKGKLGFIKKNKSLDKTTKTTSEEPRNKQKMKKITKKKN